MYWCKLFSIYSENSDVMHNVITIFFMHITNKKHCIFRPFYLQKQKIVYKANFVLSSSGYPEELE